MDSKSFGSIGEEAYLGISSIIVFRKLSVVKSSVAKPTIANCSGRSFSSAKLQRAGTNLRLVRSPVAPQIVITQGEANEFVSGWSKFISPNPFTPFQMALAVPNGPLSSRCVRQTENAWQTIP